MIDKDGDKIKVCRSCRRHKKQIEMTLKGKQWICQKCESGINNKGLSL